MLHLGASYLFVAMECGGMWTSAEPAVLLTTVLAAVLALATGMVGWREWRRSGTQTGGGPLDPLRVRQFLVVSGTMLAILFTAAIVLTGLAPLFLPMCI
jgi:hypothetical protein